MTTWASDGLAWLRRLWAWLREPERCPECRLTRQKAHIIRCPCDWRLDHLGDSGGCRPASPKRAPGRLPGAEFEEERASDAENEKAGSGAGLPLHRRGGVR